MPLTREPESSPSVSTASNLEQEILNLADEWPARALLNILDHRADGDAPGRLARLHASWKLGGPHDQAHAGVFARLAGLLESRS